MPWHSRDECASTVIDALLVLPTRPTSGRRHHPVRGAGGRQGDGRGLRYIRIYGRLGGVLTQGIALGRGVMAVRRPSLWAWLRRGVRWVGGGNGDAYYVKSVFRRGWSVHALLLPKVVAELSSLSEVVSAP